MLSDKHVTLLCPSGFIIIKQAVQISNTTSSAALHYANYTAHTSWHTTIKISTVIEEPLLGRTMGLKLGNDSIREKCGTFVKNQSTHRDWLQTFINVFVKQTQKDNVSLLLYIIILSCHSKKVRVSDGEVQVLSVWMFFLCVCIGSLLQSKTCSLVHWRHRVLLLVSNQ